MIKKLIMSVVGVTMIAINAYGAQPSVELEGIYWMPDLTANAKAVESGLGEDINLTSDLGISDENIGEIRVSLATGDNSKLRFAIAQIDYSGDTTVERAIDFSGRRYVIGTEVNSSLDVKYIRLGWHFNFIDDAENLMKVGILAEVKGFFGDVSLDADNILNPINEKEEFVAGLPTIGLTFDLAVHERVNVFGEISGITAGEYGHFIDGEIGVKVFITNAWYIIGGYRALDIKAESDDDYIKLKDSGMFIGVKCEF